MRFVDSHTEGEPTRVIIDGGPDLGYGSLQDKAKRFQEEFDDIRKAVILEPRGSDALVGALMCKTNYPDCTAGIIFFNNRHVIGMCGHGTIGVAVTLAHLGRITLGHHRFETPVGIVDVELHSPNEATVTNVESYRHLSNISVEVEGHGTVTGDVAWGGNWFFLTENCPSDINLDTVPALTEYGNRIRAALKANKVTGKGGREIDHVEIFTKPEDPDANSRNFVLCPGGAYDRSPCGTGTSAKMACLAADGKLAPNTPWIQESTIGSRFVGSYEPGSNSGTITPSIRGRAYICSQGTLLRHAEDPYCSGICL